MNYIPICYGDVLMSSKDKQMVLDFFVDILRFNRDPILNKEIDNLYSKKGSVLDIQNLKSILVMLGTTGCGKTSIIKYFCQKLNMREMYYEPLSKSEIDLQREINRELDNTDYYHPYIEFIETTQFHYIDTKKARHERKNLHKNKQKGKREKNIKNENGDCREMVTTETTSPFVQHVKNSSTCEKIKTTEYEAKRKKKYYHKNYVKTRVAILDELPTTYLDHSEEFKKHCTYVMHRVYEYVDFCKRKLIHYKYDSDVFKKIESFLIHPLIICINSYEEINVVNTLLGTNINNSPAVLFIKMKKIDPLFLENVLNRKYSKLISCNEEIKQIIKFYVDNCNGDVRTCFISLDFLNRNNQIHEVSAEEIKNYSAFSKIDILDFVKKILYRKIVPDMENEKKINPHFSGDLKFDFDFCYNLFNASDGIKAKEKVDEEEKQKKAEKVEETENEKKIGENNVTEKEKEHVKEDAHSEISPRKESYTNAYKMTRTNENAQFNTTVHCNSKTSVDIKSENVQNIKEHSTCFQKKINKPPIATVICGSQLRNWKRPNTNVKTSYDINKKMKSAHNVNVENSGENYKELFKELDEKVNLMNHSEQLNAFSLLKENFLFFYNSIDDISLLLFNISFILHLLGNVGSNKKIPKKYTDCVYFENMKNIINNNFQLIYRCYVICNNTPRIPIGNPAAPLGLEQNFTFEYLQKKKLEYAIYKQEKSCTFFTFKENTIDKYFYDYVKVLNDLFHKYCQQILKRLKLKEAASEEEGNKKRIWEEKEDDEEEEEADEEEDEEEEEEEDWETEGETTAEEVTKNDGEHYKQEENIRNVKKRGKKEKEKENVAEEENYELFSFYSLFYRKSQSSFMHYLPIAILILINYWNQQTEIISSFKGKGCTGNFQQCGSAREASYIRKDVNTNPHLPFSRSHEMCAMHLQNFITPRFIAIFFPKYIKYLKNNSKQKKNADIYGSAPISYQKYIEVRRLLHLSPFDFYNYFFNV